VKFRLTYAGKLLGATQSDPRAAHKHQIRRAFHPQIRRFWENDHYLSNFLPIDRRLVQEPRRWLGDEFAMFGYHFFPLIREDECLLCSLHILFLRPDRPGAILKSGDIDNRLATLFDALRLPKDASQLKGDQTPGINEEPFFCLLQDDGLITNVAVETDTLLEPIGDKMNANDVRLIITVEINRSDFASGLGLGRWG
jgi:hypothetical protein